MSGDASAAPRPHTGRRRNERARRAVLDATLLLAGSDEPAPLTVDAIARQAGVGRQTLYRWWSSKGAIMLEALADTAAERVPLPKTGSLSQDLETFLVATVRQMRDPRTSRLLTRLAQEAAADEHAAELLRSFTRGRRNALLELVASHSGHDGRGSGTVDLLVDQVYGTLWYRLLLGHAPLDDEMGSDLARILVAQLSGSGAA